MRKNIFGIPSRRSPASRAARLPGGGDPGNLPRCDPDSFRQPPYPLENLRHLKQPKQESPPALEEVSRILNAHAEAILSSAALSRRGNVTT